MSEEDGEDGGDGGWSGCSLATTSLSDIGGEVFFGNIGLFTAILVGIFIVHVFVVSAVEADWVLKVRGCVCPCLHHTRATQPN